MDGPGIHIISCGFVLGTIEPDVNLGYAGQLWRFWVHLDLNKRQ
jgi:hypothetical protein